MENNNINKITGASINDKLTLGESGVKNIDTDCNVKRVMTTTYKLAPLITAIFKRTFADYRGTVLEVATAGNVQNVVNVRMVFNVYKPNEYRNDVYYAFKPAGTMNTSGGHGLDSKSVIESIVRKSSSARRSSRSMYDIDITQDGKDVLSDFLYTTNQKVEWGKLYNALDITDQYNQYRGTQVILSGMDITKILNQIYNKRDAEGNQIGKHSYAIIPLRPLIDPQTQFMNYQQIAYQQQFPMIQTSGSPKDNWLVAIDEYDEENISRVFQDVYHIQPQTDNGVWCQ